MTARAALLLVSVPLALAGCGSDGGGGAITIGKAKQIQVVDFQPAAPVQPGKPFTVSFHIENPDGSTLTTYKTGPAPHTGVHLIFVRRAFAELVHLPPPIGKDGQITQEVTLPKPGPYQLLIDVYATVPGQPFPNFQLRQNLKVAGSYTAQPLPPFTATQVVDGYTFRMTSSPV